MENKKKLFNTILGDEVHLYNESVVVSFTGKRGVASTSVLNGGYRNDLKVAYNQSCGKRLPKKECHKMKADTLEGHYTVIAEELGLDPNLTTGMGTAALMENMATVTKEHGPLKVMAMVTAGIDVNGGRAGDPAAYDELEQKHLIPAQETTGTINMFVSINANMPEGTLFRAMMTATEAKTAALQELMGNSCYSTGLATGSGTDSAIMINDLESDYFVRGAGKHSVLGELIGTAVKEAVTEALDRQAGMNTQRQSRISFQAKRYGITVDKVKMYHSHMFPESQLDEQDFDKAFLAVDSDKNLLAPFAAIIHLIDQKEWGLLDELTVHNVAGKYMSDVREAYGLEPMKGHSKDKHDLPPRPFWEAMISPLIVIMAELIVKQ
ncbi:MAG: adenosylcobinamide amidohydrolase [Carboxylicivirga sp.]|jgi:adenosylcobinamide amidohydrolase|nr:adenosylcobinamide amidohydrolase [Carboxylicivirga sp.]